MSLDGLDPQSLQDMNGLQYLLKVQKTLYRTLVQSGVTTALDLGGAPKFVADMVDNGTLIGPKLKVSICMLSSTGGHADWLPNARMSDSISRADS